nr:serine/threonine-protein kinase EDR1 [Allium cepa]
MKKVFKKFHKGGTSHDPNRSNDSPSVPSQSCHSDHRPTELVVSSIPSNVTSTERTSAAESAERRDYFSSEEEYQMQLAMAISASNSQYRDDQRRSNLAGKEDVGAAEAMSRRYGDYNVVDYNERILDGFYDIYGLPISSPNKRKMPSLYELQTSFGDLGFEVIIVNRAIDNALVELEQVAQCIALDSRQAEVGFLLERISELVVQHLGGPVKDAHDMLAKWMRKSTELRMSQQTSLLPIGCITIGLSRHRSLLFKILADSVGIPCKLVKGSYYTGLDDDAVNIIKIDYDKEFLVDLMASPGTLLPADVLNAKDTVAGTYDATMNQHLLPWVTNNSSNDPHSSVPSLLNGVGSSTIDNNKFTDKAAKCGQALPKIAIQASLLDVGSSSMANQKACYPHVQHGESSAKQKVSDVKVDSGNFQEVTDLSNLFSELNPFQDRQFRATDNKNTEYRRRREQLVPNPGKLPPLVSKNRTPYNSSPNVNPANFVEALPSWQNISTNIQKASSSVDPYFAATIVDNESDSSGSTSCASGSSNSSVASTSRINSDGELDKKNKQLTSVQSSVETAMEKNYRKELPPINKTMRERNEQRKYVYKGKLERENHPQSRFIGTCMLSEHIPAWQPKPGRFDPMLDDVAELEIPWEHLIIGERIGLGSYGEVYHADWNGTEVAVKKFLDQDFYGDALDEFRSEVRIMRRLRHPNVVLFLGAVTRPPNLSIVSEFLPRGSLYRILHRPNCQIDERRRIKMAFDVALGMNCLHTSTPTVVHRDLKSPNLLVDKDWNVKVCDFGLSRLKHNTFLSSKSTAGTPEWMAPEVLRNEQSDEKCDVYSFGVILWELATLRMPWHGMNPMQVVGAVGFQEKRLEIPKEVDPMVARIILQCWQTEPSLRPSFAQLTTALKSLHRLVTPSSH